MSRRLARCLLAFAALVSTLPAAPVAAAPPDLQLPFTATVELAVPHRYTFRYSLWDAATGGSEQWSEQETIRLTSTRLKHDIGSVDPVGNPLDPSMFGQQLWVQ